MKSRSLAFPLIAGLLLAGFVLAGIKFHPWQHFRWQNEPFHSTVEALGAISAIFMSLVLLLRKREEHGGTLFVLAMGFLAMGLLDGFHAVMPPGHGFIFLRSMAGMVGGFGFALACVPQFGAYASEKKWIPWVVGGACVLIGMWTLLLSGTLPKMVHGGEFTRAAEAINLLGGGAFLVAGLRLMLDFHRSQEGEFLLFACMALLFGLSGVVFKYSALWDDEWWIWHLLRLTAYLLVLGFLARRYQRSQQELLHQERLAVIGGLSGGIAHEMKNSLGVIDSSVYYLKMKLRGADEKTQIHLDRIKHQVQISDAVIQSLRNLTGMKDFERVRTDLASPIKEAIAVCNVPPSVKIVTEASEGELFVNSDKTHLTMAFKNLVTNAVEAMDNKGTLWVKAGEADAGWIEASFKDSGPGIGREKLEKIFEPFHTTKAKGFGFGLSICRMIVEKHLGTIEARSEVGGGASFIVRLPSAGIGE